MSTWAYCMSRQSIRTLFASARFPASQTVKKEICDIVDHHMSSVSSVRQRKNDCKTIIEDKQERAVQQQTSTIQRPSTTHLCKTSLPISVTFYPAPHLNCKLMAPCTPLCHPNPQAAEVLCVACCEKHLRQVSTPRS